MVNAVWHDAKKMTDEPRVYENDEERYMMRGYILVKTIIRSCILETTLKKAV